MATDADAARQQEYNRRLTEQTMHNDGQRPGETTAILSALSEIDDLPIQPQDDKVMGQLVSKLTSTANLTESEVRSHEWVREYILVLYLCRFPTEDGCHGSWRGWAHGDSEAERDPLTAEERMQFETLVSSSSRLAMSRSEDAKVIEEGTRDVKETYVNEPDAAGGGGGGILGRIGLR